MKPRHPAAPADKRQLDAIIKALERTRDTWVGTQEQAQEQLSDI